MTAIRCDLTPKQRETLIDIVADWISEGFTTPPYTDDHYDIFEWLNLGYEHTDYDIRRPNRSEPT